MLFFFFYLTCLTCSSLKTPVSSQPSLKMCWDWGVKHIFSDQCDTPQFWLNTIILWWSDTYSIIELILVGQSGIDGNQGNVLTASNLKVRLVCVCCPPWAVWCCSANIPGFNVSVLSRSFELSDDSPNPNARQSKSCCTVPSFPIPKVVLQISILFFQPLTPRALFFLSPKCGLAL